jgi:multidrug efflux pump subunit AcrB
VIAAISLQNLILPTGTAKMGDNEYPILLNSSPDALADIGNLPLKSVHGTTIYVRDVANVRDGYSPQTNMVHVGGKRSVLMSVLKIGRASTLDIARHIRELLPQTMARLTKELKARLIFDQSLFVRAAIDGVVKEASIAAGLTALMLLLFLGSWRSTLIVIVSIPLSILVSTIGLASLGYTLNVMTLGGMALAVGILVDDATVEIENVHRNLAQGKPVVRAILDGAAEIAVPAFVSTLCICIVFVPVVFIVGAAKSLFVPLALAVVFAMLTSYFLSRTLVPTMMRYLLATEGAQHGHSAGFGRLVAGFEQRLDELRTSYGRWLAWALEHRAPVVTGFLLAVGVSLALYPLLGRDFFPTVDAGLIKLHVRGPPGTRIEQSEIRFADIERSIRQIIPKSELQTLIDNIGTPYSGLNLSLSEGALISPADGQILIALNQDHAPTQQYVRRLRHSLAQQFPDSTFFFLAPDISNQVLNFGLAAPLDVQVVAAPGKEGAAYAVSEGLLGAIRRVPGAVDVHLAQVSSQPELRIDVDRSMAEQVGLTAHDVASDLLVSFASSTQVQPSYWLDPKRGVQYLVAVQTPQYMNNSFTALENTPLSVTNIAQPQLLSNVAALSRASGPVNITHYNSLRTFDIQASVDGSDLGSVAASVDTIVDRAKAHLPRGAQIYVRGQAGSMKSSFTGLGYGLIFAIVLVYLLMVVNYQSWLDPFIILMALPGALAGIAWILYLTGTTLSVPALMGAIMCVGVATANSILVVTFANGQRRHGREAKQAALAAGMTRLRPVLMTATAMIIGMLPMSIGLGEGGEQNAPLGRAVIGGLLFATFATLFFVPVMYSILRRKPPTTDRELANS